MSRTIHKVTELLSLLARGTFQQKIDEHLHDAINRLGETHADKAVATVTITLTIARKEDMIDITPAVKSKLPEDKIASSVFWATEDGELSVQHPDQMSMFAGPRDADGARERA